jgi:large subunit ribosomal protein L29
MKASEIRDKDAEELAALEQDLRAQLIKLRVNQATSRRVSTAQFNRIRRDIARIKTVRRERALGIQRD